MSTGRPNQFREQDGHILAHPHAQDQWDRRAPDAFEGFPVRSAWADGVPVTTPKTDATNYCRAHPPSRMLVIARWGFIQTVVPIWQLGERAQEDVWDQVRTMESRR